MRNIKEQVLGILLFFISIILWLYTLLISANIPVSISKNKAIISVISLILFGVVYSIYIISAKSKSAVFLLILTFILFGGDTLNEFKYSYHPYNRVISLTGSIVIGLCILIGSYEIFRQRKSYEIKEKQE